MEGDGDACMADKGFHNKRILGEAGHKHGEVGSAEPTRPHQPPKYPESTGTSLEEVMNNVAGKTQIPLKEHSKIILESRNPLAEVAQGGLSLDGNFFR